MAYPTIYVVYHIIDVGGSDYWYSYEVYRCGVVCGSLCI